MLGDVGAEDRTKGAADGDETIKSFTLFHREQVSHEGPENGRIKKIEHTDPNKKSSANPYLLCFGSTSHGNEKEPEHDDKKSVSKRYEFSPRHPRHSRGEGRVRDQHRD